MSDRDRGHWVKIIRDALCKSQAGRAAVEMFLPTQKLPGKYELVEVRYGKVTKVLRPANEKEFEQMMRDWLNMRVTPRKKGD